ncbi:MAG TPA: hypothetical protein DEB40_12565 [Elusimicrobia bacterium]|nr:hypothetical protein [Elusimicrobiota bacterium]HBT62567.1 hypothetical protein [Elusimicrobiota bacterium]
MAITKENIQQLIALQEQDAALDKVQKEMDLIPRQIAVFKADLDAAKAKVAEFKAKTLALEKLKKEKELELAAREEAVRKHSMELNQVKTNDAFKALQQEIERDKAAGSAIETDILEAMEGIDSARKAERAAAAENKVLEDKANADIAALEKTLSEIQAKFDGQKAVRDGVAAQIPADMMRIYNHVRSRGKPDAIVPVDGENCSACRINLAPQMVIEVAKTKALVICESCQRILYKPEAAAKPV